MIRYVFLATAVAIMLGTDAVEEKKGEVEAEVDKETRQGFYDAQLEPKTVGSVPYGDAHLHVWEHLTDKGRYFVQPLGLLSPKSAKAHKNGLTGKYIMTFSVIMFTEQIKKAAFRFLSNNIGTKNKVKKKRISLVPTEKVRIRWKSNTPILEKWRLEEEWQTNTHKPGVLTFKYYCDTMNDCRELVSYMVDKPEFFKGLEIEYIMRMKATAENRMIVTADHVTSGKLFTELNNKMNADTVYLNSNDTKRMAAEATSNFVVSTIKDVGYVDEAGELKVKDLVLNTLQKHQESSEKFIPLMWESVYWERDWARPDKLTHYLNDALSVNKSDSKHLYIKGDARGAAGSAALNVNVNFKKIGIGFGASARGYAKNKNKLVKEDVLRDLKKSHHKVEWTGEKFIPKPMKLFRQNLAELKQLTRFAVTNVQSRGIESINSARVILNNDILQESSGLTTELLQARLNEKLNELNANQKSADKQQNEKLNDLKGSVRIALNHATIQSEHRYNGLRTNLGQTSSRLSSVEASTRSLGSKVGTWPPGSYCVGADWDSGCPGGFHAFSRRIVSDYYNPNAVTKASSTWGKIGTSFDVVVSAAELAEVKKVKFSTIRLCCK